MELILLAIYAFFVWLIFIKFKWLPWNTVTQVTVVIIPIVALTALILALNVFAPSSADVRVLKYVVNVVPQVRGRVVEVPVEPNRLVKKGDVLFRIDPTPYQYQVRALEAQLANAQGTARELDEQLAGAVGKTAEARGAIMQAGAALEQATAGISQAAARSREVEAQLDLARKRVVQNRELASTGAGDRFALEKAETDAKALESQLDAARSAEAQARAAANQARATEAQARAAEVQAMANERQIKQRLGAKVGDEFAQVANVRAQLENARWELEQTTVRAPADGYAINVQLRPGSMTAAFPVTPALTFVEETHQVIALFAQNELHQVAPGNEAEFAITTHPGRIIKAKVDSIVWAQGQGQSPMASALPQTGAYPIVPGRFPVKLVVEARDADLFLPAGATGHGAIYTEHAEAIHILRKVILRIGAKLDYLILKLH
jgi:multidrug resistance efflux pump